MESPRKPLVNIVSPVYNEAEFLAECVQSVLRQTYPHWRLTILNNGSTDRTAEIAAEFAREDARIEVRQTPRFLSQLGNHNAAMRIALEEGEYAKLLFGDDWLYPECLERMVAVGEQYPTAGVIGAAGMYGDEVRWADAGGPLVNGKQLCRVQFLEERDFFGSPTTVLFRSAVARRLDPFFDETNIDADTEACIALLQFSDFGFAPEVLTYTRLRENSVRSAATDIGTYLPGTLRILHRFGAEFLTERELETVRGKHMGVYYRYLGKSLLRFREQAFWDFHESELANLGIRLRRTRMLRGALQELREALLHPGQAVARLRTSWASGARMFIR